MPHNNLSIVFVGLMCCAFLSALDQVASKTNSDIPLQ